jgi:hypothetical protein
MADTIRYWVDGLPVGLGDLGGSERWWYDGFPQLGEEAAGGAPQICQASLGSHAGAVWTTP